MISVLVAVEDYIGSGHYFHRYVHVRNLYYQKNNIQVDVLNFMADEDYVVDGIEVITPKTYQKMNKEYNILIVHQANLKHHYVFLKKYGNRFEKIIFFFHGHEVLRINKAYSKPYPYMNTFIGKRILQDMYDTLKLSVWKRYYRNVAEKSYYVFVSQWMLEQFLKWTKVPFHVIEDKYCITYNCIGEPFEKAVYDVQSSKKYDFVTIRNNLNGSKYCIDFVNDLAKANANLSFLLIGKGSFFEHYAKADNLTWMNTTLNHDEIIRTLQTARCALMPTRTDAQGLMMCEMASIGMPVITSDIPVCHEVFYDFENVAFIPNDDLSVDLNEICKHLEAKLPYKKNEKYFNKNTSAQEIELIRKIYSEIDK